MLLSVERRCWKQCCHISERHKEFCSAETCWSCWLFFNSWWGFSFSLSVFHFFVLLKNLKSAKSFLSSSLHFTPSASSGQRPGRRETSRGKQNQKVFVHRIFIITLSLLPNAFILLSLFSFCRAGNPTTPLRWDCHCCRVVHRVTHTKQS